MISLNLLMESVSTCCAKFCAVVRRIPRIQTPCRLPFSVDSLKIPDTFILWLFAPLKLTMHASWSIVSSIRSTTYRYTIPFTRVYLSSQTDSGAWIWEIKHGMVVNGEFDIKGWVSSRIVWPSTVRSCVPNITCRQDRSCPGLSCRRIGCWED